MCVCGYLCRLVFISICSFLYQHVPKSVVLLSRDVVWAPQHHPFRYIDMIYTLFWHFTSWKFNTAPEKWWLEDYSPCGMVTFQGLREKTLGVFMWWVMRVWYCWWKKILHHLGCIKPYRYWDMYHTNWCRISSINRTTISLMVFKNKQTHSMMEPMEL